MIERFVARVGKVGAILILAAAIVVIGFGGGVVEHFRLTANTEQQAEQGGSQSGSSEQIGGESKEGDESGNGQKSQGTGRASSPRQPSGSTNSTGNNQQ
jgi:hypothetical protein